MGMRFGRLSIRFHREPVFKGMIRELGPREGRERYRSGTLYSISWVWRWRR